jgi:hypothetical protein
MKKLITILSIAIVLFANAASAQVVSSQGKSVTLSTAQIKYLKGCNIPAVTKSLIPGYHIRNNDTADLIMVLLSKMPKTK